MNSIECKKYSAKKYRGKIRKIVDEQIDDRELLKQALAELGGTSVLTEQSDVYSMYDENGKEVYFKKIIDNGRSITQPITFEEFQALGGVSMEEKLGSSGKSR